MRSTRPKLIVLLVGAVAFAAARAAPVLYPPPPMPYFPGIGYGGSASYLYTQSNIAPPYDYSVAHHSAFDSGPGMPGVHYGASDFGSSIDGLSYFDKTMFDARVNARSGVRPGYVSTNDASAQLTLQISDGLTPFSLDGSLAIGTPVTIQVSVQVAGTDAIAFSGDGTGSVAGSAGGRLFYDGVDTLDTSYAVDPAQASATWSRSAIGFVVGYVGYTTSFFFVASGDASAAASTAATAMVPESAAMMLDFQEALSFSTTMANVGLYSLSGAAYAVSSAVPEPTILSLFAIGVVLMTGRRRRDASWIGTDRGWTSSDEWLSPQTCHEQHARDAPVRNGS